MKGTNVLKASEMWYLGAQQDDSGKTVQWVAYTADAKPGATFYPDEYEKARKFVLVQNGLAEV